MHRFSSLLFAIVISTPLLAQSINVFDQKQTTDLITIARYCANVEYYSDSHVPRIFARTTFGFGQSKPWAEFDSRAAWGRAGSPKPLALVWYRDDKIVRVAISATDDERPRVYADYCYRQDGTLARLGPVPSVRRKCEPSRDECSFVLREVRYYPPARPVLKAYGGVDDALLDWLHGTTGFSTGLVEGPPAERTIHTFVPMNLPEYPHVTDLPFRNLLRRPQSSEG
jgi:hypothetical protein